MTTGIDHTFTPPAADIPLAMSWGSGGLQSAPSLHFHHDPAGHETLVNDSSAHQGQTYAASHQPEGYVPSALSYGSLIVETAPVINQRWCFEHNPSAVDSALIDNDSTEAFSNRSFETADGQFSLEPKK